MKSLTIIVLTALLGVCWTLAACDDTSVEMTTDVTQSTLSLEYAGQWSYSFPEGLEETGFDYDPDGGLFDAIAAATTSAGDTNYLLLSFDPMSGPGENSRIFIFDTTEPLSPHLVSSIAYPEQDRVSYRIRGLDIRDGILYAGMFGDKGLWVVDISDPAAPANLGMFPLETNRNLIALDGYVASSGQLYNGITICDCSDINDIHEISRIGLSTRDCVLAVHDDLLFVGIDTTLTVYDISDPSDPRQVGACQLTVPEHLTAELTHSEMGGALWEDWVHIMDLQADGNYVYAAFGAGEVRVIDVSEPAAPREIATAETGGFTIALTLDEHALCATYSEWGENVKELAVIDVAEPSFPVLPDTAATESMFGFGGAYLMYMIVRPEVIGDYIYVAGVNYFDVFRLEQGD